MRALKSDRELSSATLATKILMTRLRREVQTEPGSIGNKIAELHAYFVKNSFAVKDIAIF
ncbi:hypothetical protein [Pseudosulfitobacter sp. DSM 107133]|jgi:hypothetical protein|uniref:hypothetical protein n=1 Tax=Pseudosulfitobacter sp. DSM 107133 TaxID=2883100 RepID=UPI001F083B65|nr:hypothetical protein [Pseudosulfitobacter sp. DSM 107133]